jgi:hypothetical protein
MPFIAGIAFIAVIDAVNETMGRVGLSRNSYGPCNKKKNINNTKKTKTKEDSEHEEAGEENCEEEEEEDKDEEENK